jgi:hypothetical protein
MSYQEEYASQFKEAPLTRVGVSSNAMVHATSYPEQFEKGGCDLCSPNRAEVKERLEKMDFFSYESLKPFMSALMKFTNWYQSNIHPKKPPAILKLKTAEIDLADSIRRNLYRDLGEVLALLNRYSGKDGAFEQPVAILTWYRLESDEILTL